MQSSRKQNNFLANFSGKKFHQNDASSILLNLVPEDSKRIVNGLFLKYALFVKWNAEKLLKGEIHHDISMS